jgi:uncharacterized protein YkwD
MGDAGAAADSACVTRAKVLLLAALFVLAIVPGATAAPASSTTLKALCAQHGTNLPTSSLTASLICPTASEKVAVQGQTQLVSLNNQIAAAINNFRRAHGLVPLKVSTQLNASSQQHSQEMGAKGYFAHNSANGTLWWKRILHYYPQGHYRYWTVGENLLFATPDIAADAAMKAWINSPEHLANLMNPAWRNLGVSAVHVANAGGVYGNSAVTIITTDFGARH